MNPTWPEVNAAVLAALAEFARPVGSNGKVAHPNKNQNKNEDDVFVDRLFALRHAEAVEGQRREIRLLAGTVITPLARDLLKRRGVGVRFVSGREAELSRARSRGEWGFAIESRSGQADALRRALLLDCDWSEVAADVAEAAHWVVDGEGRGAFVVVDEASVATWRASRIEGIRAATACDPDSVSRACRHLGANLVVAEFAGRSIYLLKQIGERFRSAGAPTLPPGLEAHR